jgi:hypothetical protein
LRRIIFLLILVLLGLFFTGVHIDCFAQANPFGPSNTVGLIVRSPQNASYNPDSLLLSFGVVWYGVSANAWYTLDNQSAVQAPLSIYYGSTSAEFNKSLTGLQDGTHVIKVVATNGYDSKEKQVYFTIDSAPPIISNITIQNVTYTRGDLILNCNVNEAISWMAYSLDKQANVTISTASQTILPDLTEGSHTLRVYTNDTAGNMGFSKTVNFSVEPKPFPILVFVAVTSVLATVIAAIGIAVYVRRRKISKQQTSPT